MMLLSRRRKYHYEKGDRNSFQTTTKQKHIDPWRITLSMAVFFAV
jgi:hypothetical protein